MNKHVINLVITKLTITKELLSTHCIKHTSTNTYIFKYIDIYKCVLKLNT